MKAGRVCPFLPVENKKKVASKFMGFLPFYFILFLPGKFMFIQQRFYRSVSGSQLSAVPCGQTAFKHLKNLGT